MKKDQKSSNGRQLKFGASSASLAVVVVLILALLNFLVAHNQIEFDLTKNKTHAFSDQTAKVMASLDGELKGEFYGDFTNKERFQPLFENYERLSKQFKIEFIDPYKEPARTKAAGIRNLNTLVLYYQGRSVKVDGLNEERVTNAIIKLRRTAKVTVCLLLGHGESSVEDVTQSGLQILKTALQDQSYEVKEFSFPQNEIPADCNGILMVGTHGSFFPKEIKVFSEYLLKGGRAVLAIGGSLGKNDTLAPELNKVLNEWGIDYKNGLLVDPDARKMGADASLVLINFYNPGHAVTRSSTQTSYFPFARPVEFTPKVPQGFKTSPIAKSSEQSWSETDVNSFIKGTAIFNANADLKGPLSVAVATSGKLKDLPNQKESRIVAFGSGQFVNNQYARLGGNLDFFMNAVSWVFEDENLISIRAKDEEQGRVELTDSEDVTVFWLVVVLLPFAAALMGALVWLQRKKL